MANERSKRMNFMEKREWLHYPQWIEANKEEEELKTLKTLRMLNLNSLSLLYYHISLYPLPVEIEGVLDAEGGVVERDVAERGAGGVEIVDVAGFR